MASGRLSHARSRGTLQIDVSPHSKAKTVDSSRGSALSAPTHYNLLPTHFESCPVTEDGGAQIDAGGQHCADRKTKRVERWVAEQQSLGDEGGAKARRVLHVTRSTQHLSLSKRTRKSSLNGVEGGSLCNGSSVIVEEDESRDPNNPPNMSTVLHHLKLDTDHTTIRTHAPNTAERSPSSPRSPRAMNILAASTWRNLAFNMTHSSKHAQTPLLPETAIDLTTPPATLKGSFPLRQRSPLPESFVEKEQPAPPISLEATRPHASLRRRLSNIARIPTSPISRSQGSNSPRLSTSTSTSNTTATTATAVEGVMRTEVEEGMNRFLPKFTFTLSKPIMSVSTADLSSPVSSGSTLSPMPRDSDEGHLTVPGVGGPTGHGSLTPASCASSLCRKPSHSSIVFRDKRRNASSSALSTLSVTSMGSIATGIGGWAHGFTRLSSSKKKRLVVSGIARDDVEAVEGLRQWCEGFGEVRHMTRVTNGDLHVDFKSADVADTVCRVFARVYIAGVGSVHLSWISGKKR